MGIANRPGQEDNKGATQTMGVGSMNYTELVSWTCPDKIKDNKEAKDAYDKAMKTIQEATKKVKESKDYPSYNDFVEEARKQIKEAGSTSDENIKKMLEFPKAIVQGYDMMVSGAVLFSIFVLVMAFGIVALIMNKKTSSNN